MKKRRSFTPEFKTQVVLELLREEKELNQIASEHEIAPNVLRNWKKEFLANASNAFDNKKEASFEQERIDYERKIDQLYNTIGQLTVDVNWLKKNLTKLLDMAGKKELVTKEDLNYLLADSVNSLSLTVVVFTTKNRPLLYVK
jgi:transposase-like protein